LDFEIKAARQRAGAAGEDVMVKASQEMKDWLSAGEWDIDLMLRMGLITDAWIVDMCHHLIDSPWYLGAAV
jgi:hypothetical protein